MNKIAIRYIVNDVDEAIEFYTRLLNFSVVMHPAPGFAALQKDGLRLLLNAPGAGGAGKSMSDGTQPKSGGWNRFQLEVDDVESVYADLKEKGAHFRNEIVTGKGGKQVLLEDPSGNPIELFESTRDTDIQPIPEGYHTITPFILVNGANELIEFIKEAFNGVVTYMMKLDEGVVRHSTVKIGDSLVMVADGSRRNESVSAMLHLFVEDVDAVYKQALEAGGTSIRKPKDEFYGDRTAGIEDNWGNQWWIATHIEDVSDDEIKKREKELRANQ